MGHMTPHAVLLGLMGEDPENVDTTRLGKVLDEVKAVGEVDLGLAESKTQRVKFSIEKDLVSFVHAMDMSHWSCKVDMRVC